MEIKQLKVGDVIVIKSAYLIIRHGQMTNRSYFHLSIMANCSTVINPQGLHNAQELYEYVIKNENIKKLSM